MRNAWVPHGLACRASPYACRVSALHMLALVGSFEEQMQRIAGYVDRALEEGGRSFIGYFLVLASFRLSQLSISSVRTVMSAKSLTARIVCLKRG